MSAKACDRKGCTITMCNRFSHKHGHICDDCYEELVEHGPETSVEKFMALNKNSLDPGRARFDAEFPITH
jgi:hypothetical protein